MLLTGATGFVGGAVLRDLLRAPHAGTVTGTQVTVRALARAVPPQAPGEPGVEWVRADLADPPSLRGVADGVDVVLHLAGRVSGSAQECARTNVAGTRAVLEEARRAAVGRIVQLSTAAVYGPGPHRGIPVDGVAPAPASPASRSRLAAERLALARGAVVLRPGLILGAGDRWVVPALRELVERVPARWDGGRALSSAVDVGDLARLVAAQARAGPDHALPPGVYHASHPVPVRNKDLMARLAELGVLPPVTDDWPLERCLRRLRETPGRISERQFRLLAEDHWYDSEEVWRLTGCPPGPGPLARLADAAAWYRDHLGSA